MPFSKLIVLDKNEEVNQFNYLELLSHHLPDYFDLTGGGEGVAAGRCPCTHGQKCCSVAP